MARLGDLDGGGAAQTAMPHHQAAVAGRADEAVVQGQAPLGGPLAHLSGEHGPDDEAQAPVDPTGQAGHHGHHGGGPGIGGAGEVDGPLHAAIDGGTQREGMAQHEHEGRLERKDEQGAVPQSVPPGRGDSLDIGPHNARRHRRDGREAEGDGERRGDPGKPVPLRCVVGHRVHAGVRIRTAGRRCRQPVWQAQRTCLGRAGRTDRLQR